MSTEKEKVVHKEKSMELQKDMMAAHFKKLGRAKENNKKVVYTFVPGNLNELIYALGIPLTLCLCALLTCVF